MIRVILIIGSIKNKKVHLDGFLNEASFYSGYKSPIWNKYFKLGKWLMLQYF